jgi:quinate dehydrogenase (quinone)
MNWGGISIDETRDLMFVNDMRVPLRMMLVNEKNASKYKISMDEVPGFMGTLRPRSAGPYRVFASTSSSRRWPCPATRRPSAR